MAASRTSSDPATTPVQLEVVLDMSLEDAYPADDPEQRLVFENRLRKELCEVLVVRPRRVQFAFVRGGSVIVGWNVLPEQNALQARPFTASAQSEFVSPQCLYERATTHGWVPLRRLKRSKMTTQVT